jgi:hypothetical protein
MAEIIAFLKALPALLKLIDKLCASYVSMRIGQMDKAIEDGIRKAVTIGDQRDLEKAIGNSDAGEASGSPGAVIVDSKPGLRK